MRGALNVIRSGRVGYKERDDSFGATDLAEVNCGVGKMICRGMVRTYQKNIMGKHSEKQYHASMSAIGQQNPFRGKWINCQGVKGLGVRQVKRTQRADSNRQTWLHFCVGEFPGKAKYVSNLYHIGYNMKLSLTPWTEFTIFFNRV